MTPEPPAVLTVRQASAVLGMPERTLRRHLKRGTIQGDQVTHHSPWLLPRAELERVAALLWITPNWEAAEVANVANLADSDGDTGEAPNLGA